MLKSWKFWAFVVLVPSVILLVSNMEPGYNPPVQNPDTAKLQESREYFYSTCMGSGSYWDKGSDEYKRLDESCKKGMQAINNPNYKEQYSGN